MIELNEINAERARMPTKRAEADVKVMIEIFAAFIVLFVLL